MSDLPSHRLDGKREVPSYTSTTTDERDAVERVRDLAFQRENSAVVSLTLQDARDLRTLLRLAERGASPDGDRAAAASAVEPVSRLQQSQHPLREKVAREISMWADESLTQAEMLEAADRILAIPEIAEALLLRDTALGRYADALRPASIAEIYGDGLRNASPLAQFIGKDDLPSSAKPPTPR